MTTPAEPAPVAILGFGQLGAALTRTLREAGRPAPRVFHRARADASETEALRSRIVTAGGEPCSTLEQALDGVRLVLMCVPARASTALAAAGGPLLDDGALWVDLCSASPEDKQRSDELVSGQRGCYVDAAVLGAVAAAGGRVPILACGAGAPLLLAWAPVLGLSVSTLDGPSGTAARVKLLRSVYLKGRDALIAEMMDAAHSHGLEQVVAESIRGPGEEVAFPVLAQRVLTSLALHAERRADELKESASLLRSAAVPPLATEGAERRLRLWAETH